LSGLATSASVAALGAQVNGLASAVSNLNQVAIDSRNEARRGGGECTVAHAFRAGTYDGFRESGRLSWSGRCGLHGRASTRHRIPAVICGSYSNGGGREHILSGGAGIEF
jgi:hypothetical protein